MMNKLLRLLPALFLAAAFGYLIFRHAGPSADGDQVDGTVVATAAADRPAAPAMAWRDGRNTALSLAALRGKVVLVNLWATWCGPCISEMPQLDALEKRLGGGQFQVVPIALDQPAAVVQRYLERAGLKDLPVYTGDSAGIPVQVLPTSLIIDAAGRVAWRGIGRRAWTSPEVERTLRDLIAESASTAP